MRTLAGLLLLLCGCQILPRYQVPCAQSDVCDTSGPNGGDGGTTGDMLAPAVVATAFVLGQPDGQTNWLQQGLNSPNGVLIQGNKLLVADTQNSRLLIWNTFPTQNDQAADLVLGQQQLSTVTTSPFAPTAKDLPFAARMTSDGTRLIVACDGQSYVSFNRLVFFNQLPSTNYAASDFSFIAEPAPSTASASGFNGGGPLIISNQLYLSDRGFNRVLFWNTVPTAVTGANLAIGQANLTSGAANAGGIGAATFNAPQGSPASDGTGLFVADTKNNRVLQWFSAPTSNSPADIVLGQADAVSSSANRGGVPSLATLNNPTGVAAPNNRLAVADRGNHRVMLWNQRPSTTGTSGDLVLGQSNASNNTANSGGVSASSMNNPTAVSTDGTRLVVADTGNNRVLVYSSWPTVSGQPASLILGQSAPTNNAVNGVLPSAVRFIAPVAIARAGNQLLIVDRDAHRVLIFPTLPTIASQQPTVVVGQNSLTDSSSDTGGSISAYGLDTPAGVGSDGTILVVADTYNHRVLLWKKLPTQNHQPADLVLGQANLTNGSINAGGTTTGLNTPTGVFVAGNRLYCADTDNNRVLIWKNLMTLATNQQADIVLGQVNFNGSSSNHGGAQPAANSLFQPSGVYADGAHIFVSDTLNSRVLIWNTLDPTNGQAADVVLGQSAFNSAASPNRADNSAISNPLGLFVYNSHLYLSDSFLNRIAVWASIPTQIDQPLDTVLGQSDVNSGAPNAGGLTTSRLQAPSAVLPTEVGTYIADTSNGRVVVLPPP